MLQAIERKVAKVGCSLYFRVRRIYICSPGSQLTSFCLAGIACGARTGRVTGREKHYGYSEAAQEANDPDLAGELTALLTTMVYTRQSLCLQRVRV